MTDRRLITSLQIKAEAQSLGFLSCGIARAEPVSETEAAGFEAWLNAGHAADMDWLRRHTQLRLDPRRLLPTAKSVVAVALSYAPEERLNPDGYQMAAYALGRDYHDIMRGKLRQLAAKIGASDCRVCCDTAPIPERYWAWKAGLGWLGRNHQLITPQGGSMVFLGELLLSEELEPDTPLPSRCGTCRACLNACPTRALDPDTSAFDARRCLSYQTIEHRGPLSTEAAKALGGCIYGCDRCQLACPWNSRKAPLTEPALRPSAELKAMTRADWHSLTEEQYRVLFRGSAVKRAKYEGLMRNIRAAEADAEL